MKWIQAPDVKMKKGEDFTVSFSLTIDNNVFWQWAVLTVGKTNLFSIKNITSVCFIKHFLYVYCIKFD